jgi:methionyl aminopeptidase
MVNAGTWQVKLKRDGWTVITRDRQLSAQFEHTVGVTEDGREVFTVSPAGKHHPVW